MYHSMFVTCDNNHWRMEIWNKCHYKTKSESSGIGTKGDNKVSDAHNMVAREYQLATIVIGAKLFYSYLCKNNSISRNFDIFNSKRISLCELGMLRVMNSKRGY